MKNKCISIEREIYVYIYMYNLPRFKVWSKYILINNDILEPLMQHIGNDIFHNFE